MLQATAAGLAGCWLPSWAQPVANTAAPPLPVAQFFQRPVFSGAKLSPSGQRVAVRASAAGQRDRLAVLDAATMKLQVVAAFKDADVRRFHWVNDQRLVYDLADHQSADADLRFAPGLFAVNADGSGYRSLVHREHVTERYDRHLRELPWNTFLLEQGGAQDGDHVFVVQPDAVTDKGFDYFRLLKLNTVTGLSEEIEAPRQAFQWLIDARGELRAVFTAKGARAAIHWRNPADGRWQALREFERFGLNADFAMHAVAPDGRLYVTARPGTDTEGVYLYDPATDQLQQPAVLALPQFDIDPSFVWRSERVAGLRHTVDAEVTQWFDEAMRGHQAEVDRLLPATANRLTPPRRGDGPFMLVRAQADVQPAVHLLYNSATRKLVRLGAEQPHITPSRMAAMDFVRYKARDGLEIPAYLTLPPGHSASAERKPPLVVLVHGGPWVRGAEWEWQAEVQFLASRGYAVLQPEFRGSTGFGQKHFTAGWRQWGRAMQDDLADGVRWAVAQGHADARRVAVLGASYGGYAALMGLVRQPEVFRCAVAWAGVSDLLLMFDARWSDTSDAFKRHGMPQLIGDREKDAAELAAHSPLQQAARIRSPLLLGHGRVDRRVPIEHGRRLRDAVRPHNPALQWVEYEKEGHGWALPETQADWWGRVEAFLGQHLAPVAA
jgi:dipeptidyl aminopeptidase/acylaminoacyl peptidase